MLFLYVVDDIINIPLGEGKEHTCPKYMKNWTLQMTLCFVKS